MCATTNRRSFAIPNSPPGPGVQMRMRTSMSMSKDFEIGEEQVTAGTISAMMGK